jgi:tripartite-type tricarboxylate transporter receptor subunit TctC
MGLPRRHFLGLAAGAVATPAVSRFALADAYPLRPVHLIVGFAAAGPSDIAARASSDRIAECDQRNALRRPAI